MNKSVDKSPYSQFLSFSEYASISVLVVGSLISAISRQVIYIIAPLSVSVLLNWFHRQRLEQQLIRLHQAFLSLHSSTTTTESQKVLRILIESQQSDLSIPLDEYSSELEFSEPTQKKQFHNSLGQFTKLKKQYQELRNDFVLLQSEVAQLKIHNSSSKEEEESTQDIAPFFDFLELVSDMEEDEGI